MTQAHSRQAEEHSYKAPQASLLDTLFDTHRILNIAIAASSIGILILLSLAYLLRNTSTVLHLGILASLMLILCAILIIYKGMITENPYDRVQQRVDTACVDHFHGHPLQNKKDEEDDCSQSDDSSIYEVVPKTGMEEENHTQDNGKEN